MVLPGTGLLENSGVIQQCQQQEVAARGKIEVERAERRNAIREVKESGFNAGNCLFRNVTERHCSPPLPHKYGSTSADRCQ